MEQREIKFRIWDKAEKRFLQEAIIDLDGDIQVVHPDYPEYVDADKDDVVLMQYVEKKNLSGEVYEGDIVAFEDNRVLIKSIYKAEWLQMMADDKVISGKQITFGRIRSLQDMEGIENTTTIGNIFQHPELLNA